MRFVFATLVALALLIAGGLALAGTIEPATAHTDEREQPGEEAPSSGAELSWDDDARDDLSGAALDPSACDLAARERTAGDPTPAADLVVAQHVAAPDTPPPRS